MTYENTPVQKIEELDLVRITITLPRDWIEDEVVEEFRAQGDREETVRMVGLTAYLVAEYGAYYGADLLDPLLCSLAERYGVDDNLAKRLHAKLEQAIREHHDDRFHNAA